MIILPIARWRPRPVAGVVVTLTVTDVAGEYERLVREGAPISMPLREEPWAERLFQLTDPNGVVVRLVEWVPPAGA